MGRTERRRRNGRENRKKNQDADGRSVGFSHEIQCVDGTQAPRKNRTCFIPKHPPFRSLHDVGGRDLPGTTTCEVERRRRKRRGGAMRFLSSVDHDLIDASGCPDGIVLRLT